jgi:hypothetical protein
MVGFGGPGRDELSLSRLHDTNTGPFVARCFSFAPGFPRAALADAAAQSAAG